MLRRNFLQKSIGASALSFLPFFNTQANDFVKGRFTVGACDWSINNTSNLGSFETASLIGLDGAQVSLGLMENNMHMRKPEVQKAYKELAKIFKVRFTGLAIGELNNYPYKSDNRTDQWVSDSIDVAKAIGVPVVLLAFFSKGDLKNDFQGQEVVIGKLKEIGGKAEKKGIILGIESWLSAAEHMRIIEKVASPNIKVYYDVANSEKMGYNIYEEMLWLGKKNMICEFHFKENGFLLGEGKIDFQKVRRIMDEINYSGSIQIEGSVPEGKSMLESYVKNNRFVRELLV